MAKPPSKNEQKQNLIGLAPDLYVCPLIPEISLIIFKNFLEYDFLLFAIKCEKNEHKPLYGILSF